jgi:hypothetical protein
MTYQSDGKDLTKLTEYFVGGVKQVIVIMIGFYYVLFKQIVASKTCNQTSRKILKMSRFKTLCPTLVCTIPHFPLPALLNILNHFGSLLFSFKPSTIGMPAYFYHKRQMFHAH